MYITRPIGLCLYSCQSYVGETRPDFSKVVRVKTCGTGSVLSHRDGILHVRWESL